MPVARLSSSSSSSSSTHPFLSTFPRELSAGCAFHAGCDGKAKKRKRKRKKTSTLSTIPRTRSPAIWLILPMDWSRYDPRLVCHPAPGADGSVQTIVWAAQKCCVAFNESQQGDEAAACSLARRLLPGFPIRCTSDDERASRFFPFLQEDLIKSKLSQSGFRVTALLWLMSPYFHFFFFFF